MGGNNNMLAYDHIKPPKGVKNKNNGIVGYFTNYKKEKKKKKKGRKS